jgi:hypothetical protein
MPQGLIVKDCPFALTSKLKGRTISDNLKNARDREKQNVLSANSNKK